MTTLSSIPSTKARIATEEGKVDPPWYRWFARIEKLVRGAFTAGTGLDTTDSGEITIADNGVTNAMLAQGPALSVVGVTGDATADRDDIEAASESMFLQRDRHDALVFRYPQLPAFNVAGVPSAATQASGTLIYVYDEAGGATVAFSDSTNWRRVQDRAIIS